MNELKIINNRLYIKSQSNYMWFEVIINEYSGSFVTDYVLMENDGFLETQSCVSASHSKLADRALVSNYTNRISNGNIRIQTGFMAIQGTKGTWYKISIHEDTPKSGSLELSYL